MKERGREGMLVTNVFEDEGQSTPGPDKRTKTTEINCVHSHLGKSAVDRMNGAVTCKQ